MSELREPKPVRLITGIIYKPDSRLKDCIKSLEARFGEMSFVSDAMTFTNTKYYENEMGPSLMRKITAFKKLIRREDITDAKIFTNKLEKVYSYDNKRTINIDPGYIAQEHLILATGKGFSHRPYIGKGVYADLTLIYINDEFRALDWTYPDYRTLKMRELFKQLREEYANQLKEESYL